MKPILVLCPAFPKSGTTSLYNALGETNQFTTAILKESHYLWRILRNKTMVYGSDHTDGSTNNGWTREKLHKNVIWEIKRFSMWQKELPVWEFIELLHSFVYDPANYDKYIRYHSCLGNLSMDFSLLNFDLSDKELNEVKKVLDDYFDIRTVICLREPKDWVESCYRNGITLESDNYNYEHVVEKYSKRWPTLVVKMEDFEHNIVDIINEFFGCKLDDDWRIGHLNKTDDTKYPKIKITERMERKIKENRDFYYSTKTAIVSNYYFL